MHPARASNFDLAFYHSNTHCTVHTVQAPTEYCHTKDTVGLKLQFLEHFLLGTETSRLHSTYWCNSSPGQHNSGVPP